MHAINPGALWLLPLIAVLLLLSRLQSVPSRRAVSNLYMWRATNRDAVRLAATRLRLSWLLVLQASFMLTVIAALAHPVVASRSRRITIVFDASASMGASDGAPTRLEAARARATAIIDGLASTAHVRVVAAGSVPSVVGEFLVREPALRRAVNAIQPGAGTADMARAVDFARVLGGTDAEIEVLSDSPQPSTIDRVGWIQLGRPADNVAITALAARRLPTAPQDGQVLVELFNYGSVSHDADIELSQDGRAIARRSLRTEPRSAGTLTVDVPNLQGVIAAQLVGHHDALAVDDRRLAIVPALSRLRVQLVTAGNFFLEQALTTNPALTVEVTARADAGRGAFDVIVCDGCRDVPPGHAGVLMVAPAAAPPPAAAPLTISMPSHALAAGLETLGSVGIPVRPARSIAGGDVVLRAGGHPAVVAYEGDGRRLVEIDLDVTARAALPLTTVFPVLLANAVDWLSAAHERPTEVVAGTPLHWVINGRDGSSPLSIVDPGGRVQQLRGADGGVTFASTDRPGVYTVHLGDKDQRFVVNPATETESDLQSPRAEAAAQSSLNLERLPAAYTDVVPWLLVLAVCLLAAEWWVSSLHCAHDAAVTTRAVIATLLVAGAAGLRIPVREGPAHVVFAIDQSDSMGPDATRRAVARVTQVMAHMRPNDRVGIVLFGANAALERRPAPGAALADMTSTVVTSATNIEAALGLSRAVLPRDGVRRIVLISDGRETAGDAVREAGRAAAADVPIDVMPPDPAAREFRPPVVTSVTAPDAVRVGEPFLVSVEFAGSPRTSGRATIFREGEPPVARDVEVGGDGTATVTLSEQRRAAGLCVYRATIRAGDDQTTTPEAGTTVSVTGEARVLYVASGHGAISELLGHAGFRILRTSPLDVPASADALAPHDAVVLDDVPPDALNAAQTSAIAQYVEDGGGLLVLGSARALDPTGYAAGPLAKILPIDLRPRSGRQAPPMAFVLVFDKSGSMADRANGVQKIELARQAAMKVLDVLPPTDPLGIVAFDASPTIVAPLTTGHDAASVAERLRGLEPGGSTAIAPAIGVALTWLDDAAVSRRHVLLVTDGRTSPADADRLRAAVRDRHVELSVVGIGPDADRDLLARLAQETGGRAYFPDDPRRLSEIVARDAAQSSGSTRVEEPFTVRAAPHAVLAGISSSSLPRLRGYAVSALRPGADPILTSHLDDPVLAAWRYGLGSVGVFTSNLGSPWADTMTRWAGFNQLWSQTVRWLSRRTESGALRAALSDGRDGPRLIVEAERPDGTFVSQLDATAVVRMPDGDVRNVPLRATAPGRYEAAMPTSETGPYAVTIVGRDPETGAEERVLRGLYWSADRERMGRGVDMTALARLARMTGGSVLTDHADPFDHPRPAERRDVSSWLAAAALALFLVDLARRRGVGAMVRRWRHGRNSGPAGSQAPA